MCLEQQPALTCRPNEYILEADLTNETNFMVEFNDTGKLNENKEQKL